MRDVSKSLLTCFRCHKELVLIQTDFGPSVPICPDCTEKPYKAQSFGPRIAQVLDKHGLLSVGAKLYLTDLVWDGRRWCRMCNGEHLETPLSNPEETEALKRHLYYVAEECNGDGPCSERAVRARAALAELAGLA